MKKILSKMKLIHLIFLILGGLVVISALPFKTQYARVYVNYTIADGIEKANREDIDALGTSQAFLFDFFDDSIGCTDDNFEFKGHSFDEYKVQVYEFSEDLNSVNYKILYFGIITLIAVAILCIFSNQSRKIYYTSNVIVAVICCLSVVGYGIFLLISLLSVMGNLNQNLELYNIVSILQDATKIDANVFQSAKLDVSVLQDMYYVNASTIVAYIVGACVVVVYALFVLILSIAKFKNTATRRKELIQKAVENND